MYIKSDNIRGAALMMGSMAAFVTNDTLIKVVSTDMSLYQAIFIRGIMATLLIGLMAWRQHALTYAIRGRDRWLVGFRTLGEVGGSLCFLTALYNMPLANATAILQSLPLAITLGAALFFKEQVGWRRYTAICIGFIGVMIVIRPGSEGFNTYSLLALAAVGFIVVRDLTTRRLTTAVPSLYVAFVASTAIFIVGAVLTPTAPWSPVSLWHILVLGGAAISLFAGYLLAVMTMRVGEISFVTPFRYTILIWAILLGMLVFGDIPDGWTLLGISIIVGSGLFTVYRERKLHRQASRAAIAAASRASGS